MAYVEFHMAWECYGKQTIELPDEVNVENPEEILEYIEEHWDSIFLPDGADPYYYVQDSDSFDSEGEIIVYTKEGRKNFI